MATRYAVASGDWSNTTTVWSDSDGGSAGSYVPVDGDAVVISAGVNVLMDVDQSGFTGLQTVTIRGGSTPGMLYWANGSDGHLKVRTGYNLVGTLDTNRGRLLANSDGSWSTSTALQYSNTAVIDLQGTAKIEMTNLDAQLHCDEPTVKRLRLYTAKQTITNVNTTTDVLTIVGHGYSNGDELCITSSGDIPTGLYADRVYYVRSQTTDTFQLATYNADYAIVDITGAGSGTIEVYDAPPQSDTVNTLDDVTSDNWTAGDACVLVNAGAPENYDQQRLTVDTINAGSVVLSASIDSAQYPGCQLWLVSRNVRITSSGTASTQPIIDYDISTHTGHEWDCEIRNTAGSGTTFYGRGVYAGTSHTVSGTISGCYDGIYAGTSHTVSGTISGCNYGIWSGTSHTISGTISGCYHAVYAGTSHTVSGTISGCSRGTYAGESHTVSGTISGCYYGIYYGTSYTVSGTISGCSRGTYYGESHTVSGTISGCLYGVYAGTSHTVSGTISGCNYGIYAGTSHTVSGTISGCNDSGIYLGISHTVSGTISGCNYGVSAGTLTLTGASLNNTTDVYQSNGCVLFGAELAGTTQVSASINPYNGTLAEQVTAYDLASSGTVAKGSLAVWSRGGEMESAAYVEGTHGDLQASGWAAPDPDWIHTATMSTTALDTGEPACPLRIDLPFQAIDGETVEFEANIELSTASDWTALPRIQIVTLGKLFGDGDAILDEDVCSAATGWQNLSVSHACTAEEQLALRVYGTRTARNGSFDWCWRQVVGSGGTTTVVMPCRPNSLLRR